MGIRGWGVMQTDFENTHVILATEDSQKPRTMIRPIIVLFFSSCALSSASSGLSNLQAT